MAKPIVGTRNKVPSPWVNFLLGTEIAFAVSLLLVAPFEAITNRSHLRGLVLAVLGSILALGIDATKLCMLGRTIPKTTPLCQLPVAVLFCYIGSMLVWVTATLTGFVVVLLTCLQFENFLIR